MDFHFFLSWKSHGKSILKKRGHPDDSMDVPKRKDGYIYDARKQFWSDVVPDATSECITVMMKPLYYISCHVHHLAITRPAEQDGTARNIAHRTGFEAKVLISDGRTRNRIILGSI